MDIQQPAVFLLIYNARIFTCWFKIRDCVIYLWFNYVINKSVITASNDGLVVNKQLEKMWKKSSLEILYRNSLGRNEQNYERVTHHNRYPVRPEYEAEN
jgi:hypothetical protein